MAVENLDQLVDLILSKTPTSGEDLRTFVRGEIRDFLAHQPSRYSYRTKSMVFYEHYVNFINFIIDVIP